MSFMPAPAPTADTRRLYYFTGRHWGMKCLWEKRLKVAEYRTLNDPYELAPFEFASEHSRKAWDALLANALEAGHGVLCFAEDWHSAVMWSQYGERHTGLCLGFDVAAEFARPIEYIDRPLPDPIPRRGSLRQPDPAVIEAALRYKHGGWRHEREWRLRVRLDQASDGLFYKAFDEDLHLREVIIGPRCPFSIGDVAEAIVNPPLDVDIIQAEVSGPAFEVRQHEKVSTHTTRGFRAILSRARDAYHHELSDEDEHEA